MKKKLLSLLLATSMLLTFAACGSSTEYGLTISALSPTVDTDKAEDYAETLTVGDDLAVSVTATAISSGDDGGDALTSTTNKVVITAQITGAELDVILADYDNGAAFANIGSFLALEDVFTEEELSEIDESLFVTYEETDDEGNGTGENLAICGIDVSSVSEFSEFMSGEQIIVHVVANTENLDEVKEYILSLLD